MVTVVAKWTNMEIIWTSDHTLCSSHVQIVRLFSLFDRHLWNVLFLDESLWNDIEINVNYNLDFIKAHTYGYNRDKWDQSLKEENKIRLAGGMNGLNLSTVDVYNKMQVKYLRGGLIKVSVT